VIFYCPSNRNSGQMDLSPFVPVWGDSPMPPFVGACDYSLCKGANAGLSADPSLLPPQVRGLFNITQADSTVVADGVLFKSTPQFRIRLTDVADGLSNTFALGEAAGGSPYYLVADVSNPTQPVTEPFGAGPAIMDQAWAAASLGDTSHPWFAGLFGVTAQFGMGSNPADEPMNRRPGMPTIIGSDRSGYNLSGRDMVSGFRSRHPGGGNFLYADGSVHFIPETIDPITYRALSTYAGGD